MFLNTLHAKQPPPYNGSLRDALKSKIETILGNFIGRHAALQEKGQPVDFASKCLMHAAVLMFENIASQYLCAPINFYITMLYSVLHGMLSESRQTRLIILKYVLFFMRTWYNSSPFSITDVEWERNTSTRMALAMSAHPRLGTDCPLNLLDPGLLPRIALQWQHRSFPMWKTIDFATDFNKSAAKWAEIYTVDFLTTMGIY
jgi:hypothetical protein